MLVALILGAWLAGYASIGLASSRQAPLPLQGPEPVIDDREPAPIPVTPIISQPTVYIYPMQYAPQPVMRYATPMPVYYSPLPTVRRSYSMPILSPGVVRGGGYCPPSG